MVGLSEFFEAFRKGVLSSLRRRRIVVDFFVVVLLRERVGRVWKFRSFIGILNVVRRGIEVWWSSVWYRLWLVVIN